MSFVVDLIVGASRQKGCSSENHTAQPYTRAVNGTSPAMCILGKLRQAAQCCRKEEFWVSSRILLGGWFPWAHWQVPSLTVIAAEVSSDWSWKNKCSTAEGGRLSKLWFYRKIEKWTNKSVRPKFISEVFCLESYTDKLDGFPSRLEEQVSLAQKHTVSAPSPRDKTHIPFSALGFAYQLPKVCFWGMVQGWPSFYHLF